jgi:anti-anti-sigma factor
VTDLARVETEQRDATCLVRVHGEIDMSNARELLGAIETAMPNSAEELVVDLTGVSYVDSAGVALLLRLAHRLQGRRQEMSLMAPHGSPVREVLELAAVPKLVPLVERLDR